MPKRGDHVMYVEESGKAPVIAHVLRANGNTVDLQEPGGGVVPSVPRREPEDYDEKGGGRTWHEC